ncbi:exocyst complex component EXO70H1-like [Trifolium pratense]|uniref:exocyst complex component EXO70H1-like n=1 Tax=Trifolium pratense TaxID=57577 RepID=UPI001E691E46|nr:exocyst complex component EXO70H1-like [Trifolium pratense]
MRKFCLNPKTPSFSLHRNTSSSISSSSSTTIPSIRKATAHVEAAESLILKWNSETSDYAKLTSLFYNDKNEAIQYIDCVNNLQKAMHSLLKHDPSSPKLIKAKKLMEIAMNRLQKEFYQILSMNRAYLDSESVSVRSSSTSLCSYEEDGIQEEDDFGEAENCISEVERVSSDAVDDLRIIADSMVSNGYGKECVKIYTTVRKSIVDEGIYKLNVEERSFSKLNKMDWEVLEMKINSWLEALKISVRTLFAGERILCDRIFAASRSVGEACFAEISRDGATLLLRFPEFVVKTKKSKPEKIFRLLDMYTAITVLSPDIELIFSFNSTSGIKSQAYDSQNRLMESIRNILSEFEYTILKDSSKLVANFGGVHSLTKRTMQYLTSLADYSNVLSEIFLDVLPSSKSLLSESYLYSPELSQNSTENVTGFSVQMMWLIQVLLCKIDVKSKQCKNVSLSYLFLANNLRHIVEKVRSSYLQYILGDDWLLKHIAKVKQFMENYERVAWGEVFSSLPENPKAALSVAEAREVFMKFNLELEKAYRKQSPFVVPESKFCDETKASLARKIVPIYRELYDRHYIMAGNVREMMEYVKFIPEDVHNYLMNLFCGVRA